MCSAYNKVYTPGSSAEAERLFCGLRRIKSYLRNKMVEERLSGLSHALVTLTLILTTGGGWSNGVSFTSTIHVQSTVTRRGALERSDFPPKRF